MKIKVIRKQNKLAVPKFNKFTVEQKKGNLNITIYNKHNYYSHTILSSTCIDTFRNKWFRQKYILWKIEQVPECGKTFQTFSK